jgi:hypothetical protein
MPIQNWKAALNRFVVEFGERVTLLTYTEFFTGFSQSAS